MESQPRATQQDPHQNNLCVCTTGVPTHTIAGRVYSRHPRSHLKPSGSGEVGTCALMSVPSPECRCHLLHVCGCW